MISKKNLNDLYQIFIIIEQNTMAGLNVLDALKLYAKNSRPYVKQVLDSVQHDLETGIRLPDAFAKHPKLFPSYIVEMMKVSEGTGQAEEVYKEIVRSLEQEVDLRRNIGSQMGQAVFLLILLAITVGIVIFVVLPSMGKFMSSLDMQLPFYTKVMIDAGIFAESYWFVVLPVIAAAVIALICFFRANPEQWARLQLKMPVYRPLAFYALQYRFCLVLALCKNAGLDTIRALEFTASGSDNILMDNLIIRALKEIRRTGGSFTQILRKMDVEKILDESIYMFLEAGEKSDMGEMMFTRAAFYKKQLTIESQMFNTKLSNILLTPIVVVLGLIMFAVLSPLFNMMGQITSGGIG